MLVDGVTKLDKLKYGDSAQAETVRKMVVAMSKDIRVLIIKLADRLHNARTWGFVAPETAARKAQETLEIYAPLAHRLGIQTIKWELEDLSFAVLYPKLYVEIESLVKNRTPEREEFVQQSGRQGLRPDSEVCQNLRDRHRVGDVRLPRLAGLPGVGAFGGRIRPLDERHIGLGMMRTHRLQQTVDGAGRLRT
jgi:hypothetical protein